MAINADKLLNKSSGRLAMQKAQQEKMVGGGPSNIVLSKKSIKGIEGIKINVIKIENILKGWCGLKLHDGTQETDLGYRFMQKYWGKGYATEASLACIDYGFKILNLKRIIGNAMKENVASIKVFKKLSMIYFDETLIDGVSLVKYEIKKLI